MAFEYDDIHSIQGNVTRIATNYNSNTDAFYNITKAKKIDQTRRVVPTQHEYMNPYKTDYRSVYESDISERTVDCHVIEIDEEMMCQVVKAIEETDRLRQSNADAVSKLNKHNATMNEFHTFMAQHPDLREQYTELMTMCKLVGLRNIP